MNNFIQVVDIDCWRIILRGPAIPTKKNVEKIEVPILESEYSEAHWKLVQLNAKALNMLHCALDVNEYNRISTCTSAKQVWDKLEVTYEGTNQVKESKINPLWREYELFSMKLDETISSMNTRFSEIVNSLKNLGRNLTDEEMVKKILRSLPEKWETKVTVLCEAKDLRRANWVSSHS